MKLANTVTGLLLCLYWLAGCTIAQNPGLQSLGFSRKEIVRFPITKGPEVKWPMIPACYTLGDTITYIAVWLDRNCLAQYVQHGDRVEFLRALPIAINNVAAPLDCIVPVTLNRFLVFQYHGYPDFNADSTVYLYDAVKDIRTFLKPADSFTRSLFNMDYKNDKSGVYFSSLCKLASSSVRKKFLVSLVYYGQETVGSEAYREKNLPIMAVADVENLTYSVSDLRNPYPVYSDRMFPSQSRNTYLYEGHAHSSILAFYWTPEVMMVDAEKYDSRNLRFSIPELENPKPLHHGQITWKDGRPFGVPQFNASSVQYFEILYNPFRKEYLRTLKIVPRDTALASRCIKNHWFGILADSAMRPIAAGMLPVSENAQWHRGIVTPAGFYFYSDNLSITDTAAANSYQAFECYEPVFLKKLFDYDEIDSLVSASVIEYVDKHMQSFLTGAAAGYKRFVHVPIESSCAPCMEEMVITIAANADEFRQGRLAVVLSADDPAKADTFLKKLKDAGIQAVFDPNQYLDYSTQLINPAYYYVTRPAYWWSSVTARWIWASFRTTSGIRSIIERSCGDIVLAAAPVLLANLRRLARAQR